MANVQKDLGPVSAYAIARKHGYQGTEKEWAALQIAAADNAAAAQAAAKDAAETLETAAGTIAQETGQAIETINAREEAAVDAVAAKEAESVQLVQDAASAAGEAQQRAIEAKGEQTLATIPDDYATLHANVQKNAADILHNAPAIIPTATGEVIAVNDSAERPLAGLTLYGKTTQDGTPSPDAPVPLVNVGNGGHVTAQVADGGSVTVSTPNGLPGIPVASGGNYTDSTGQQWICDEVDFGRGVYVQRCYIETLSLTYDATYDRYKCGLTHPANMACGDGAGIMCLCDKLAYSKTAGAYADERGNGIRVSTTNTKLAVGRYDGVEIGDITIMYPIDAPIETPLSADALSAYHAMTSRYPETTVTNDAGAGMKLEYIADTKTYVDRKIAAIAAAQVAAK